MSFSVERENIKILSYNFYSLEVKEEEVETDHS